MKTKKILVFLALISVCVLLISACNTPSADTQSAPVSEDVSVPEDPEAEVYIHTINELNSKAHEKDSHAADYRYSTLEQDYNSYNTYEGLSSLGIEGYYSRIKLLDDGRYMLVFHNKNYGGSVYVAFGKDIDSFGRPTEIFGQVQIDGERKLYMTPDAEQMPDGRILVTCSYRSTSAYSTAIGKNGIALIYSDDGGKTWSEQKTVYYGTNWEPSILVTGEKSANLFFTSTAPTIALYGFEERSGMVGMISTSDNGETWTPSITGAPWKAQIVAQRFLGMDGNIKRMTDQMPVATILNNGTTVLAVEEQIGKSGSNPSFSLGFAYSNKAFNDVSLEIGESGPSDVIHNIFKGAGPYIRQFGSGETVLTYHWALTFRYRLGSSTAKQFNDEVTVFTGAGHWGSVEVDSSHTCVMTIGKESFGLYITRMYLNHVITAAKETPSVDGNGADWIGDEAWFIGSDSQAQSSVRVAHDDDRVYVLCERIDKFVDKGDAFNLYFANESGDGFYNIKINADGTYTAKRYNNSTKRYTEWNPGDKISVAVTVCGTVSDFTDKDRGVVYEVSFDKSLTKLSSDGRLQMCVSAQNRDSASESLVNDSLGSTSPSDMNSWIPVKLG